VGQHILQGRADNLVTDKAHDLAVVALLEFSGGGGTEPSSQEAVEGHGRAAPLDMSQNSNSHPKAQFFLPLLEIGGNCLSVGPMPLGRNNDAVGLPSYVSV